MSDAVTIDAVQRALSMLGERMRTAADPRAYGVNCAWVVVDELRRGKSIAEAVAMIEVGTLPAATENAGVAPGGGDALLRRRLEGERP